MNLSEDLVEIDALEVVEAEVLDLREVPTESVNLSEGVLLDVLLEQRERCFEDFLSLFFYYLIERLLSTLSNELQEEDNCVGQHLNVVLAKTHGDELEAEFVHAY